MPPPRRNRPYFDTERDRWMIVPAEGGGAVPYTPAQRQDYDARAALRRAGVAARSDARELGRSARRASSASAELLTTGAPASPSAGELVLYMAGSVLGLAILRNVLEGRGPAAVQTGFAGIGQALRKLVDPADPLIPRGAAAAPPSAGPSPQSTGTAAAPPPSGSAPARREALALRTVAGASASSIIGGEHATSGLPVAGSTTFPTDLAYPAWDVGAPAGTPVLAPEAGTVVRLSGRDPALGPSGGVHGPFALSLYLKGASGAVYFLTHLGSLSVREGQAVGAGQPVGTVADYARWGGANHVHVGVDITGN